MSDELPPSDDASRTQRMVEYLRQNAQTYSFDALRRQLIDQGERPELVDVALASVRAELPQRRVGVVRAALPWAGGALVVALVAAGVTLIGSFDWLSLALVAAGYYAALGVLLVIAGAIVQVFRRRIGVGMLFGGLFTLALCTIGAVIFFGVCLVLLSQGGL